MPIAWIIILCILGPVMLIVIASSIAKQRWKARSEEFAYRIISRRAPNTATTFGHTQLTGLPRPVARYFERSLKPGQPLITTATLEQVGTFMMSKDRWNTFNARQQFNAVVPGFLWDAEIHLFHGGDVLVRDSYDLGRGGMRASMNGLITLMNAAPSPDLNAGTLQRYLAELIWLPTALLPSNELHWSEVNDTMARATLTNGGTSVTLEFTFAPDGTVARIHAPQRMREVKGRYVPTPWNVRPSNYAERHGMLIPLSAEVAWELPEGDQPYWRGSVTTIRYDHP